MPFGTCTRCDHFYALDTDESCGVVSAGCLFSRRVLARVTFHRFTVNIEDTGSGAPSGRGPKPESSLNP